MRTRLRLQSAGPDPAQALTAGIAAAPEPTKFSADRPWRGPILGDNGGDPTRLLIALACDPGIGIAFGVACVPLLDTADDSPRLPGGKNGVGLGDGEDKVKQALRDCVIWVPHRIDSTTPLETVSIPLDRLAKDCSRMLPLLISHLAPLDSRILAPVVAPVGVGRFSELYVAVSDPNLGLGVPYEDVRDPKELEDKLIDSIFNVIDPRRGAWDRFESIILHLALPGVVTSAKGDTTDPDGQISFFLASCLYPAGLFDGTPRYGRWSSGPADASLCRLAQRIALQPKAQRPAMLIMTGDQIYADASAGLFDARLISDRLQFGYERLYRGRGATEAFARVLPVMLIDDHEIRDNWEPEATVPPSQRPPVDPNVIYQERDNRGQRDDGVRAYWKQERAHWHPLGRGSPLKAPIDVEFSHDGANLRLVDTRTRRRHRTAAAISNARLIREDQMRQLRDWLGRTKATAKPRFIDTPSVFLPRHRVAISNPPTSYASAVRSDAWDGYPRSQHELLAFLVSEGHENVVFLSGDEHVSFVTWAKITNLSNPASVVIRSVHSSSLYTPFPFANSDPDDLAGDDNFDFDLSNERFRCEVKTRFFDCGAGFARVVVTPSCGGSWDYRVEFIGERDTRTYQSSANAPWS